MTREEAIKILKELPNRILGITLPFDTDFDYTDALNMAIKALEQEPRKDEVILTKEEYGELVSSEFDNGYAKGYREALEQEPCVEPLERLAESAAKTAKALERLDILDEIRVEIDRQRKWLLQAGYTAYNLDIAFNSIKSVIERGKYDD